MKTGSSGKRDSLWVLCAVFCRLRINNSNIGEKTSQSGPVFDERREAQREFSCEAKKRASIAKETFSELRYP
jgi:hypothetical protein